MQLHEIKFEGQHPVDSYGPGFFRVMGEVFEGNMFLSNRGVRMWDGYGDLVPLMRDALEADAVPFEVMATPSACRTYNVLLAEDRRVALAVLAV